MTPAVRLFVGSHAYSVQGAPFALAGDRCFTAARQPERVPGLDPAACPFSSASRDGEASW